MQQTRKRIIDHISSQKQTTVLELSQFLDMTPANIRHHLSELNKEGKVEAVGLDKPAGPGRPKTLYTLSNKVQQNSLDVLASALLDEFVESGSEKKQQSQLRKLAKRLQAGSPESSNSITLKLGSAVQRLNKIGHEAHWEAHVDSPRIILEMCPFAPIIDQYPELCQMEGFLIEEMLGISVEHTQKIARKPEGPLNCIFRLNG